MKKIKSFLFQRYEDGIDRPIWNKMLECLPFLMIRPNNHLHLPFKIVLFYYYTQLRL